MIESVEIFPWSKNFETGIAEIDSQHMKLVALLNKLVSHLAFNAESPSLSVIFDELTDYAIYHFGTEERLWLETLGEDPWVDGHHNSHEKFIEQIVEIKNAGAGKAMDEVIDQIVRFLTHWLALHILESDRLYAKAVLFCRSGLPLAEAKKQAHIEMSGAARTLIDAVMSMYDKLASRTLQLTREISRRRRAEQNLDAARQVAEAANQAKSQFLAHMSHEIRTPLSAITGLVHLMRRDGLAPGQEKRVSGIEAAGQHLLSVINDILDLSKIESGMLSLEEIPLAPDNLVFEAAALVTERVQEKGLILIVDAPALPFPVRGDRTRLKQILLNYAANAVKFTERGEIRLRLRLLAQDATLAYLRFEVEDTGCGISHEAQERVFGAFEQESASTTRRFGGAGLGLAINRSLAERMGGTVGVRSVPGQGSLFWLEIALSRAAPGAVEVFEEASRVSHRGLDSRHAGKTVLLAEDNPINREVAQMLLEDVGIKVELAENGQEALDKAAIGHAALVLMDMEMPVLDGLEATRQIRQHLAGRPLPIIAMTANAFLEDRDRCLEAGMDDFLSKPVEPATLYGVLNKWLSVEG